MTISSTPASVQVANTMVDVHEPAPAKKDYCRLPRLNHPRGRSAVEAKIEISINQPAQLFNSLDPSPFHERDLDRNAEEYIVGSAEEISRPHSLVLVIHLPSPQLPKANDPDLSEAIHNYFAYREAQERRRLRRLFHDGRIALTIGLTFLFCCVLFRQLAFSFGNSAAFTILAEGLLIIGWVAMWRPLEIFLYEWVPIRRHCRILAELSKITVVVQPKPMNLA